MAPTADPHWLLDRAEVADAALAFVWQYQTDISHWSDPPARFELDGPFESGAHGTTRVRERDSVHWTLRDVEPQQSYTIESVLDGAVLPCRWSGCGEARRCRAS